MADATAVDPELTRRVQALDTGLSFASNEAFEKVASLQRKYGFEPRDKEFKKAVRDWFGDDFYDYWVEWAEEEDEDE